MIAVENNLSEQQVNFLIQTGEDRELWLQTDFVFRVLFFCKNQYHRLSVDECSAF